jgi:hypothetical protein
MPRTSKKKTERIYDIKEFRFDVLGTIKQYITYSIEESRRGK